MSLSNFDFPVSGVTGTAYRDKMKEAMDALLTTNSTSGDPTITKAGMLQIKTSPTPSLRVRNTTDTGWVTLLPDLSQQYGGLAAVITPPVVDPIQRNLWSSSYLRDSWVTISSTSPSFTTTQILYDTTSKLVNISLGIERSASLNGLSGSRTFMVLPVNLRPQFSAHIPVYLQGAGTPQYTVAIVRPNGDVEFVIPGIAGGGIPSMIGEMFYYAA
jgi:hypothetical protein